MVTDEVLFERLVHGDLRALDVLYERYVRRLFGFIVGQLGDRQEAEDVLHDAFLTILRERRADRQPLACFRAWIFRVARNLCLNRVRTGRRAARAADETAQMPALANGDPEGALLAELSAQTLLGAVTRLPAPLAELFHLRAGGLSYEEVAQILEIPLGTVKSRMHEHVSRLRAEVQS